MKSYLFLFDNNMFFLLHAADRIWGLPMSGATGVWSNFEERM